MRMRRVTISAAALFVLGSMTAAPAARAASATTLYVGTHWPSATCSDTAAGAGSQATPFCTIQAAVDKAQPGYTVLVGSGSFAPFTVSTSGTAGAPITITSGSDNLGTVPQSTVWDAGATPAVTISGANYVDISGLFVSATAEPDLLITGSSHVGVDGDRFQLSGSAAATQPLVHLTGGSSSVTLSRDGVFANDSGGLLVVDGGGAGDVITTSYLGENQIGPGVVIDGAPDIEMTSNTLENFCGTGIQILGGSAAVLENNVVYGQVLPRHCTVPAASILGLSVDGASAAASTADYNVIDTSFAAGSATYSWAGNTYSSAAAFASATGHGTHDVSSYSVPNAAAVTGVSPAAIDSANADAPGELATDVLGHARIDDPVVPDTGSGAHGYYDRGAVEQQPTSDSALVFTSDPDRSGGAAPVGGTVTVSGQVFDGWNGKTTCAIDFGDGSSAKVPVVNEQFGPECDTPHQYATTGTYTPTLSVTFSDGTTKTSSTQITINAAAPLALSFSLAADSSTGVTPHCSATSGWTIDSITVNFGDEGAAVENCDHHIYERPGTYTVTMTATDAGGNTASVTKTFTTAGDYYTPVVPTRILDTRTGLGTTADTAAKVPANGTIKLKVTGVNGLPLSGIDSVALNVTVTNPAAGGYVSAYPDGIAKPTVSNLNFAAGETIPNTVIVKVGAGGYIDLTNASGAPADLIADVQGFYSADGSSGYRTVTPTRVLDTRTGKTTIPANGTAKVYFGSYTGATAVTVNLTAVNAKQGGYLTAYPSDAAMPKASNVNFTPGQVIQNEAIVKVGADGYVDFTNGSGGSVDLIVDLTGYFTDGTGMGFVPINPTRVLDTRQTSATGVSSDQIADVSLNGAPSFTLGAPEAVAANVTVTGPAAGGYVTVYPGSTPRPSTSVLNFTPGQTIANATTVGANNAQISLYNGSGGSANLIMDVFGFYN